MMIQEQTKDAYTWRITYHDGPQINEYDEARPDGRGFSEIDISQVKRLRLITASTGIPAHIVTIPEGATPVFFRRRTVELRLDDEQQIAHPAIHCIGWKQGEQAAYLFVMPDGSTLLTDDLQAV